MAKPTDMEQQQIMMEAYLKENTKTVKNMEWASILHLKVNYEWENGEKVKE